MATVVGLSQEQRWICYRLCAQRCSGEDALTLAQTDVLNVVLFYDHGAGCTLSVRQIFAASFCSSRETVANAIRQLEGIGWIASRRRGGRGASIRRARLPWHIVHTLRTFETRSREKIPEGVQAGRDDWREAAR